MRADHLDAGANRSLLRFYRLEGTDARGRRLDEIWQWNRERLEHTHDYIQWLFPLPQPSAFNPEAPLLTADVIQAFHSESVLRQNLNRSLNLMVGFYGLRFAEAAAPSPVVVTAEEFSALSRQWLRPDDHNHLRLSRILRSTRLLGLGPSSDALFTCLDQLAVSHPGCVTPETRAHWRAAVSE